MIQLIRSIYNVGGTLFLTFIAAIIVAASTIKGFVVSFSANLETNPLIKQRKIAYSKLLYASYGVISKGISQWDVTIYLALIRITADTLFRIDPDVVR